ncbi:MAG TPA: tetratricopeptide repeat protein [Caulobacteraceae bacterium]|nr:tetratricopeptide repeat protein [Caulobacteraceae bacterium]
MTRLWFGAAALAGALSLSVAAVAMGSGGGGMSGGMSGGMGGLPSQTTPAYDPAVEYQHGVADLNAGKFKDAAREFGHVVDVDSHEANTWYLLGLARAGAGDERGAAKALERSVKLDADNPDAHKELGVAYARLKETDKAKAELAILQKKAADCGDSCAQAAALKADVAGVQAALDNAPTPAAALPPSQTLLFAGPAGGDAAYDRAVSLINARRFAEAEASLRESEKVFGPHPDILTYLGYVARKQGRPAEAARYYRAALAVAPAHRGAMEYYGELEAIEGDFAAARVLLAKLDAACPFGCAEADALRLVIDDPAARAEAAR